MFGEINERTAVKAIVVNVKLSSTSKYIKQLHHTAQRLQSSGFNDKLDGSAFFILRTFFNIIRFNSLTNPDKSTIKHTTIANKSKLM